MTDAPAKENTLPNNENHPDLAVIGGGISGLYSALLALDAGQKNIHVYEATDRAGGKIISKTLPDGQVLNMGAEFIDDDHERIVALCKRFNIPLHPCIDQKKALFQGSDGRVVPDFIEQYAPIAKQVICDREAMESDPAYAATLKNMPVMTYLKQLAERTPINPDRGVLGNMWDFCTFQNTRVSDEIINIAANSFTGEAGQPVENITAAQFIAETSPEVGQFLGCGQSSRVEGGTQAMIDALHKHLETHGVKFHYGEKLEAATKGTHGGTDLTLTSTNGTQQVHAKNTVIGLPTYALANVRGLETFGLSPKASEMLVDVQYTNNMKITIPIKPGIALPQLNLFQPHGVQSWSPAPGYLTFLCTKHDELTSPQLIKQCMEDYAKAYGQGKTAADIFDIGPGKIALANPGKAGCWSTAHPKNAVANEQLFAKMESLADQGLGIVGTYMPLDGLVGFMECGAASAERAHARMMAREKAQHHAISTEHQPHTEHPKFLQQIISQGPARSQGPVGLAL